MTDSVQRFYEPLMNLHRLCRAERERRERSPTTTFQVGKQKPRKEESIA